MKKQQPRYYLFGIPIQALTMKEVLSRVDKAIFHHQHLLIGVINAAKIVNMKRDAHLRRAVLSADMILPDGMSIVWACRILGRWLPERITGIDLMHKILERGQTRGYRIYCLGATDEILNTAIEQIKSNYPGISIVGKHNGYFRPEEEPEVVKSIQTVVPDILFVAMNTPKKEQFLARWNGHLGVPVCHGVGGAFDVIAGKVHRAPAIWQRMGMEWLYRLLQEPRRLWRRYLITNVVFCFMVFMELFGTLRPTR